jgi:hypothetical protein
MSFEILGKSGHKLDVTSRNMARALATTLSPQADATILQTRSWSVVDVQTPTGANDYFFYMSNSSQRDLLLTFLMARAVTAETIQLQHVQGTAVGGTTLAPRNRTLGSGRVPGASVSIQSGVDITGLTPIATYENMALPALTDRERDLNTRVIRLRPGNAIALLAVTGAIAITYSVNFIEQVIDPVEII